VPADFADFCAATDEESPDFAPFWLAFAPPELQAMRATHNPNIINEDLINFLLSIVFDI
jgi:hypothetical protein